MSQKKREEKKINKREKLQQNHIKLYLVHNIQHH